MHSGRVQRGGNLNFDLLAQKRRFEITFQDHFHLHLCASDLAHQRYNAEGQRYVFRGAISKPTEVITETHQDGVVKLPHQLKLAVGRDETDGMFRFELAQLDALMELAIIDDDDRLSRPGRVRIVAAAQCSLPLGFHYDLVVYSEFAFGHAGEVRLHDHFSGHVRR